MPTYANKNDLEHFFSTASITDWADKDRDGVLSESEQLAVDTAIEASEAVVDSYLVRGGYNAPFDVDTFANLSSKLKSLIRQWTVVITGFHLYAWRGMRDKVNPFESLYRQVMNELRSLAGGASIAGIVRDSRVKYGTGSDPQNPTDNLDHLRSDAWDW
jgi:phage gp36-like protein